MIPDKLPGQVLLHRTNNAYFSHLKRILQNWNVEVFDASVRAEYKDDALLETVPIAIALISEDNFSGIDFLRSIMHSNSWTQRFMLSSASSFEIFERAVNKAHINYLLPLPPDLTKLALNLRKALRRYETLTRPFAKFNTLSDIAEELLIDNQKYYEEANTDSLTKLMNRRSFNNILQGVWQKYTTKNVPFSLALIDIDHFKKINDNYGHSFGDLALQELGKVMLENKREGIDYAFRYGGEEFALLSINTNMAEMKGYIERLLSIVRKMEIKSGEYRAGITFSSGIATVLTADSPEHLIDQADKALYNAKASGRNRVLSYSPV